MTITTTLRVSALALALCTASGCKERLEVTFDAEVSADLPQFYPDGEPDDEVFLLSDSEVATAIVAVSSDKKLMFAQTHNDANPIGADAWGYFYAEPLAYTEDVYVQWEMLIGNGAKMTMSLAAGHFASVVDVRYSNGEVFINNREFGHYPEGRAFITQMSVSRTGTASIRITGGGASGDLDDVPLLKSIDSDYLQLISAFDGRQVGSHAQLDDLYIYEQEPDD